MIADTPQKTRGFALLFTLVLLSFVSLLLVNIGLLTRVETQVSIHRGHLSQGRQNALLALDLALAHLQREAGPDQRLTARSEIETTAVATVPYLTGVWAPGAGLPELRSWLVSGNHGENPLAVTPGAVPSPASTAGPDEVFLLDRGSVSTNAQRIKLRREPINVSSNIVPGFEGAALSTLTVGHFAYWIGDQGIKASLAFPDRTSDVSYDNSATAPLLPNSPAAGDDWWTDVEKRERLRQLQQARPRSEALLPGFDPDASTPGVDGPRERLSRVLTYAQLAMVSPSLATSQLKTQFHHATMLNRGVLTDLTEGHGRLRKDFSDTPDVLPNALQRYLRLRPSSVSGLRAHYRLQPSTPLLEDGETETFPAFSVGPVLTECLVKVQFFRNPSDSQLCLRYEIQAELWNPYTSALDVGGQIFSIRIAGFPGVEITAGDAHATIDLDAQIPMATVDPMFSWAPGQIVVLRGGDTLTAGGPSRVVPIVPSVSIPVVPPITEIAANTAAVAGDSSLRVDLFVGGEILARYRPHMALATSSSVNPIPESDAGWLFGFGFGLRDDLGEWMNGTRVNARDPRRTQLSGEIHESAAPRWGSRPDQNLGDIPIGGTDVFDAARHYPLFELPRQEVVSVGSLQHMIGGKPLAVGNEWGGASNDLFDQAFFSTLPRWAAWNPAAFPTLPNPYLEIYWPEGSPLPPVGDRDGGLGPASDYLLDLAHAAKYLMIRGAFNVNSTSMAAWRIILGGARISSWSYGGDSPQTAAVDRAYFRFGQSAQESSSDPSGPLTASEAYDRGVRTLRDADISAMATSIVNSLRTRGRPFSTLSEFVNAGVIANAIDAAGINAALPGNLALAPLWLSQGDVLTRIASFLTPRSDTFLIRAYGDSQNPASGLTEARAWCEAIVQRFPDLTDPAFGVTDVVSESLAPDPAKFPLGRRFKVVFFRWLSPDDI